MNEAQQRVFNETRLRNLKRTYARLIQYGELSDTALSLKKQINELESAMT